MIVLRVRGRLVFGKGVFFDFELVDLYDVGV